MKKIKLIFVGIILTNMSVMAQPVTTPVPTTVPTQAANAWYRGGNNTVLTSFNVFGFQTGSNSQIWYQTNGFNRMMMNNGTGLATDGKISIGNNIPSNFIPQERAYIHHTTGSRFFIIYTNSTTCYLDSFDSYKELV